MGTSDKPMIIEIHREADPITSWLEHLQLRCMALQQCSLPDGAREQWSSERPSFHLVLAGECTLHHEDGTVGLQDGDLAILLEPANYRLANAPNEAGSGESAPARLLSGAISLNPGLAAPVLEFLPSIVHLSRQQTHAPLLCDLLGTIGPEFPDLSPGTIALVNMTLTLVVTEVVREQLATVSPPSAGWMSGLCDQELAPVLSRMLQDPGHDWTVDSLAAVGCMARSTFARRFRQIVGESPMEVLKKIRMDVAGDLLRNESGLKEVSRRCGYTSISAFSAAFTRFYGITSLQFRSSLSDSEST